MGMRPLTLVEGSAAHRAYVRGSWAAAVLVIAAPVLAAEIGTSFASLDTPARIAQLNTVVAFAVAILGLDLVVGFSGQLALGQSAFVGLGAYTTVILVVDHHWSFYAALPATAAVSFAGGLLVGIPATRVKGVYLAIVTLVVAFCFPPLVVRLAWLTGGSNGKGPPRTQGRLLAPSWAPFADAGRLAGPLWVYCLCVTLAVGLFVIARNLVRSRVGRATITMRDHEPAAVALGVHVAWYKAMAFGLGATYGGLAGAMLMMNRPFATDGSFGYRMSIFLLAALVIGGTGTISGAVPGALAYVFVPYYLTQWAFEPSGLPPVVRTLTRPVFVLFRPAGGDAGAIFFGLALVVLTFVLPGGAVGVARRVRARVVTVVADPPWLAGFVPGPRRYPVPRVAAVVEADFRPADARPAGAGPVVIVPERDDQISVPAPRSDEPRPVTVPRVVIVMSPPSAAAEADAIWRR